MEGAWSRVSLKKASTSPLAPQPLLREPRPPCPSLSSLFSISPHRTSSPPHVGIQPTVNPFLLFLHRRSPARRWLDPVASSPLWAMNFQYCPRAAHAVGRTPRGRPSAVARRPGRPYAIAHPTGRQQPGSPRTSTPAAPPSGD